MPIERSRRESGLIVDYGVDKVLNPAEVTKSYFDLASRVDRLYRALGVDERKNELSTDWGVLTDLARGIRGLQQPVDVSKIMDAVERLLDAKGYAVRETTAAPYGGRVRLGGIDFAAFARSFPMTKHKASAAEAAAVSARQSARAGGCESDDQARARGATPRELQR